MASLIPCPDCKREVSKYAKTCPHCGATPIKRYGWGTVLCIVFIGAALYGMSTTAPSPSTSPPPQQTAVQQATGACRQFVALHSIATVAHEAGTTEDWVVAKYRINVWEKTTAQGRGRAVGKIFPGSMVLLLETSGPDLKVQSPLDNSVGWVNQIQVAGLLMLNDTTFAPCH